MLTAQQLPPVEAPHLAQAALANRVVETAMTTPRKLSLSHVHGVGTVKRMIAIEMQVRERAYIAANAVQFLDHAAQNVVDLLASEAKEVQDAAWRQTPPDGTLPPRRLSLTFLSRGKTSLGGPELLNAASHLASEVPFGCTECSARTCRFAFFAGADAEQFLRQRRDALPEASRRMELIPPADGVGEVSVAVTWATRMQSQTILHTRVCRLPTPSSHGSSADLCDAVVSAVAEVCSHNQVPATSGITAHRNAATPDAFVVNRAKVLANFQALLMPEPTVTLSAHMRDGPPLDFNHDYVRITSRFLPINHFTTNVGVLLHEKGKAEQTQAWLQSLRDEEPSQIYGLRPPSGAYEEQLGLHILSAVAESISLGTQVSTYALGCHPGARLDVRNGCSVWAVKRMIAPLEQWLTRENFVLPCARESAHPRAEELRLPLFELMENAVISTAKVFGANPPVKKLKEARPVPSKAPTDDDRFLATAFGLGLHVDAVRVGDVQDRLAEASGRADGLTRLLLLAVSKVGASASVTEAFAWIADTVPALEKRLTATEDSLHAANEAAARQSEAVGPPPPPRAQVDIGAFVRAVAALGLVLSPSCVAMTSPAKEDEVEKLLTLVAKTFATKKKDLPPSALTEARSAHVNCDRESLVARVSAVATVVAGSLSRRCLLFANDCLLDNEASVGLEAVFAAETPGLLILTSSSVQFYTAKP